MQIRILAFCFMLLSYLLHIYLVDRVRLALQERHSDVWQKLSSRASFVRRPVYDFIWKRLDKALGDPDLSRKTVRAKIFYSILICEFLVWGIFVFTDLGIRPLFS